MELFVGIRLKPFQYGMPVNSYILENDGKGNFTDATGRIAPELENIGMVRDMLWEDVDSDGDKDMILAGDWMPLIIFINEQGTFKKKADAFGAVKTNGWWNCLAAGDFDADGDVDFVAGNHGLNSRFKPTPDKPVSMYVNDFDLNGTVEQIVTSYDGDVSYPLALKHDLTRQIPGLEKKYPTYESFKDQMITDMFTPEQFINSARIDVTMLETSVFINDGTGTFTRKSLPAEVQFSTVYAASIGDYNNDGKVDLILGGNLFNTKPEVGRYDASYGSLLTGDGNGNFSYVPAKTSGLHLEGEIRNFREITTTAGNIVIVARSNGSVQVFKIAGR
jgi:hypothetical protein